MGGDIDDDEEGIEKVWEIDEDKESNPNEVELHRDTKVLNELLLILGLSFCDNQMMYCGIPVTDTYLHTIRPDLMNTIIPYIQGQIKGFKELKYELIQALGYMETILDMKREEDEYRYSSVTNPYQPPPPPITY
jgi:hypothetical protein